MKNLFKKTRYFIIYFVHVATDGSSHAHGSATQSSLAYPNRDEVELKLDNIRPNSTNTITSISEVNKKDFNSFRK